VDQATAAREQQPDAGADNAVRAEEEEEEEEEAGDEEAAQQ
jgi:hypothetical protein